MYFYGGYGIHGTYWHNNFGTPMSHGCVNMRTSEAEWVFNRSVGRHLGDHPLMILCLKPHRCHTEETSSNWAAPGWLPAWSPRRIPPASLPPRRSRPRPGPGGHWRPHRLPPAEFAARRVAQLWQDMVVPITERLHGEADERFGPEWYRVGGMGYAHSSGLQPVEIQYQPPVDEVRFTGTLAEVSVPFVDVYHTFRCRQRPALPVLLRLDPLGNQGDYDRDGTAWYRIMDDKFPDYERWAPADRLRIFPDEELAPISPDVPPGRKAH